MSEPIDIETIQVPRSLVDLAERRTRPILHASMHDANMIRTLMLSCYLQGLEDGYESKARSER